MRLINDIHGNPGERKGTLRAHFHGESALKCALVRAGAPRIRRASIETAGMAVAAVIAALVRLAPCARRAKEEDASHHHYGTLTHGFPVFGLARVCSGGARLAVDHAGGLPEFSAEDADQNALHILMPSKHNRLFPLLANAVQH